MPLLGGMPYSCKAYFEVNVTLTRPSHSCWMRVEWIYYLGYHMEAWKDGIEIMEESFVELSVFTLEIQNIFPPTGKNGIHKSWVWWGWESGATCLGSGTFQITWGVLTWVFFPYSLVTLIGHCVGRQAWAPMSSFLHLFAKAEGGWWGSSQPEESPEGQSWGRTEEWTLTLLYLCSYLCSETSAHWTAGSLRFLHLPLPNDKLQGFSFDESCWAMIFSLQDDDLTIRQLSVQCGLPVPYL